MSVSEVRRGTVGIRVAAAVVAVLIVGSMTAVTALTTANTTVLVGTLDSPQIMAVLVLAGAVDAVVVAFSLRGQSIAGRVGVVLTRMILSGAVVVAGAGVFLATLSTTVVSTLVDDDGCDTGYVVREETHWLSSSSTLYRMDGFVGTRAATLSNPDAAMPFHDGEYAVTTQNGTLRVSSASAEGGPVAVPKLTPRAADCGLTRPTHQAAPPAPTPAAPITLDRAEAEVTEMYARTRASVAGDHGPAGETPTAPTRTECDSSTARSSVTFTLATPDNAASVARILATWDAAGYERDRAIQLDIRFDPETTVSLRLADRSTIDGLIHATIATACLAR
ncbi:hypothetical protein ACH0CG_11755 [Microbacterium sp. 179-I 1D1 NHS]|uniref:hypothetical protein n=1 Tax=Microbacterium sp. 179-I 1D1 NHS TaxID=3374298 RepID=UPI00387A4165